MLVPNCPKAKIVYSQNYSTKPVLSIMSLSLSKSTQPVLPSLYRKLFLWQSIRWITCSWFVFRVQLNMNNMCVSLNCRITLTVVSAVTKTNWRNSKLISFISLHTMDYAHTYLKKRWPSVFYGSVGQIKMTPLWLALWCQNMANSWKNSYCNSWQKS